MLTAAAQVTADNWHGYVGCVAIVWFLVWAIRKWLE